MTRFTDAVRACLEYQNWYGALALTLTLPDICAGIEYPSERSSKVRYSQWFDRYLGATYKNKITVPDLVIENTFLTGADCYALRCAYLHQGIDDTEGQPARETLNKFHFTTMQMHRLMAFDMLTLNVRRFCLEFCGAADRWAEERGGDARVADELGRLLTIQSGVFSPHPRVQNVQCAPDPECASRGERPSCN